MSYIPDDILYIVCTHLWHKQDFDTLFSCACSGKRLATIAIPNLYRVQGVVPATISWTDEDILEEELFAHEIAPATTSWVDKDLLDEERFFQEGQSRLNPIQRPNNEKFLMKCAGLWRTIILSSLGKTLYPYSQYIRTLNLRDLERLLTQSETIAGSNKDFFQGELAKFKVYELRGFHRDEVAPSEDDQETMVNSHRQLDVVETVNEIGEAITKQTPLLEELIGEVFHQELSRWIPRLPQLTFLELWEGTPTKHNGALIRSHCRLFKALHLREWNGSNSDHDLAAFLNELRPQSLKSFKMFGEYSTGTDVFQVLNCHGTSLIELRLIVFLSGTSPQDLFPQACTNLISLSLTGYGQEFLAPENSTNYKFLETVAWLKQCKKLQTLAFTGYFGNTVIAPILLETSIRLTSLLVDVFGIKNTEVFFHALSNQTSLQSLWLKGDVDDYERDIDVRVKYLSKLVNLTHLRLMEISAHFVDWHIVQLASSLPKLELWWTCGSNLTDAIWVEIATLRSLRRLGINASMSFTTDGILEFIGNLGPGNHGLALSVVYRGVDCDFLEKPNLIQGVINEKLKGTFDFVSSVF